jgi:hypothetical protein
MDDIPVMFQLFEPAMCHLSVERVLRVWCFGLYLSLQLCVVLGLILCGHIIVRITLLS